MYSNMPSAKWRPFCLGLKYGNRGNKQRVLTPGHQGGNDLHSLCRIGMVNYLLDDDDDHDNNNNNNNNNNNDDNNNNNYNNAVAEISIRGDFFFKSYHKFIECNLFFIHLILF